MWEYNDYYFEDEETLLKKLEEFFKDRAEDQALPNPIASVYGVKNAGALSLEFTKLFSMAEGLCPAPKLTKIDSCVFYFGKWKLRYRFHEERANKHTEYYITEERRTSQEAEAFRKSTCTCSQMVFQRARSLLDKKKFHPFTVVDEILQLPNEPVLFQSKRMVEECDLHELRYPENKKRMNLLLVRTHNAKYLSHEKTFMTTHFTRPFFTFEDVTCNYEMSQWGLWRKINDIPMTKTESAEALLLREKFLETSPGVMTSLKYQPRRI